MQPPEPPPKGAPVADTLQFVFLVMIALRGFHFVTRPTANTAQLVFRLATLAIGIVGLISVFVWKQARR